MAITKHYRIEEQIVEGKRLGRHVHHDDRSLQYRVPVPPGLTPATVRWKREIPVLDQGQVGSCTGNAATGHCGTDPTYPPLVSMISQTFQLDENEALALYSAAEIIDGGQGYPPEDDGSSGLSVAQAAKNAGLISGYLHITSLDEAHAAIQSGPFIVGSNWYSSFDTPDANGLVTITDDASVRGGHEYECIGYNAGTDLWELVNSWGLSYGNNGHFFYSTATFQRLLYEDGDATQFVPLSKPAPVPSVRPSDQATDKAALDQIAAILGLYNTDPDNNSAQEVLNDISAYVQQTGRNIDVPEGA